MSNAPIAEAETVAPDPVARKRLKDRRVPVSAIAIFGFGVLVAVAVGAVLLVGILSATKNTSTLLQDKGESVVSLVERDIDARLSPAVSQSQWIANAFAEGKLSLEGHGSLDAFMLGALAGTPQIAGMAIVTPDAQSRRWTRAQAEVIQADWSADKELVQWVRDGTTQSGAAWRPPFWTEAAGAAVVMLDTPLKYNDEYLGMLAQVVPIAEISSALGELELPSGMTPFVLYGRTRVLAHPTMINWKPEVIGDEVPLPALASFGDIALRRIWTPDEDSIFILRDIKNVAATGAMIGDNFHIYLSRSLKTYGDWTVGVYFNTDLIGNEEYNRLVRSLWVGLGVLVIAVIVAARAGRRISVPVEELADAARAVETRGLEAAPAVPSSRIKELDDALIAFNRMVAGLQDREVIRRTLGRFVPEEVAQSLLSAGGELEVAQAQATVLFCDIEGFTALTERVGPDGIMTLLNEYFEDMVSILERHHGVVTQFQGDAILATFNVPIENPEHAANALRAALEMHASMDNKQYAGQYVKHRIGINTGSVVAGAVGASGRLSYTVHGDAVNLASRLESLNKELGTRILVSEHTYLLVQGFDLHSVGATSVRGQSKPVKLFELRGRA